MECNKTKANIENNDFIFGLIKNVTIRSIVGSKISQKDWAAIKSMQRTCNYSVTYLSMRTRETKIIMI